MSLARALTFLPPESALDSVWRDVLTLFSHHAGEWLDTSEVAVRTGEPARLVTHVLEALRRGFVIDFDGEREAFRYRHDPGVDFEIESFLRRSTAYDRHRQDSVARYRERFGSSG